MPSLALNHHHGASTIRRVDSVERIVLRKSPSRRGWKRMLLSIGSIEVPAACQDAIADFLSRQSAARVVGQKSIFWIGQHLLGSGARRAPIGVSVHNPSMQLLDAVAAFDELGGELIEQLRMAGLIPPRSKVVGGSHKSLTKMPLPDSVDHDTSHQRVACDPIGQLDAATGLGILQWIAS